MVSFDFLKSDNKNSKAKQHIRQPNYRALSQIDSIKIDVEQRDSREFPSAANYLKLRLERDLSKIITVSQDGSNSILRCDFRLSMKIENKTVNTGTLISIPTARVEANLSLEDLNREILFAEDRLSTGAALSPLNLIGDEEELVTLTLRRLSVLLVAKFAEVLSQTFLANNSTIKATQLLLELIKSSENLPTGVNRGYYASPYSNFISTMYSFPNEKVKYEGDITDEWGLVNVYRDVITDALIKIGEPVVPFLIQALKDENFWLRMMAIDILGRLKSREAVQPLITLLNNDSSLYSEALVSLSVIGDSRCYDYFISALKLDFWPNRVNALKGLIRLNDRRAIESISSLLKTETHSYTKKIAKEALSTLKKA